MNIRYSVTLGRFELEFSVDFEGDKAAAKAAGWKFQNGWYTESIACINRLRTNKPASGLAIYPEAKAEYTRLTESDDPSRALTSDIVVPSPSALTYAPYQLAAVAYARNHPQTLIGDEPGSGKTIEAMAIINDDLTLRKILVVAPAFLKPNWLKEFRRWDVHNHSIAIVDGKDADWPTTDVVVINYDILINYRAEIRAQMWDLLVVDEIHQLQTKKAARTREVLGGVKYEKYIDQKGEEKKREIDRVTAIPARRKVYMTGTPSGNGKPKELWPILQSIDPYDLGRDWFAFAKRYCQAAPIKRYNPSTQQVEQVGWMWDGRDNLGELQERMRKNFMIRRLKVDVLPDLKAKRRMVIPIQPGIRDGKAYTKELQDFKTWAKNKPDALFEMPNFTDFSRRMLETGLKMVKPCIEIVESELLERDKIVVMVWHNEVGQAIVDALGDTCISLIDVPANQRVPLTDKFQTDPKFTTLVCTYAGGGVGLTMTAAELMVCPERPWAAKDMEQGEDRTHRWGQIGQALYMHLVPANSIFEYQCERLIEKLEANEEMLDKKA